MHPVTSFTIVYDASCRLCTRLKDWIGRQPSMIRLQLVATGSAEVRAKFPNLPSGGLRGSLPTQGRCGWAIMPGLSVCGRCETAPTLPTD